MGGSMDRQGVIRLEPLREGYFPELDDGIDDFPAGSAAGAVAHLQPQPASAQYEFARIPLHVASEILEQRHETLIAANPPVKIQPGTPECNHSYLQERLAQLEQTPRPDPPICAIQTNAKPPTGPAPAPQPAPDAGRNPWVLNRFADAVAIFGPGLVGWFVLQAFGVAALAWGLMPALAQRWVVCWACLAALTALADWLLWLRVRRRIYTAAVWPALVVLVLTVVLGLAVAGYRVFSTGEVPGAGTSLGPGPRSSAW